ncbi:FtsQ-type POTRA domain-containing protein [Candidatus Pelagibacter sp.]|nr:FtsQ-type POTRA domain-containing protein [Candidatus Pelagibacter sp.]
MHQLTGKKNKVIVYLLLFFILSTTSNKTIQIQHNYPKEIIKIEVLGLSEENNLKIKKELNNLLLKNIFLINTNTINNVMSKYKLIQSYNVKKEYPSKLNIEIEQTKFIARIKSSKNYLIGSNGKLINGKKSNKRLPILFGDFDDEKFLKLKKNIDNSKFKFNDIKSIFFFKSKRWDLQTIDDVLIKLPEKNIPGALTVAYKIIEDKQFLNIKIIDLRILDQVIITNE